METTTLLAPTDRPIRARVRREPMLLLAIVIFVTEALLTASMLAGA